MKEKTGELRKKDLFCIDFDDIVRKQNSKLVRSLPQFIVNYLKKVVRQDELNHHLHVLRHLKDIDFIKGHADFLNIKTQCIGMENLPDKGRFIFVCNHPLGAVDFYAALIATTQKYPEVKALANDILLVLENLRSLFLPVKVFGRNPAEYLEMIRKAYASEIQIMTFPAGEVSRLRKGKIIDGVWHRSFVRNAVKYKRDIIPIYIDAKNSARFYSVGSISQLLGIKLNLELFLRQKK